MNTKNMLTLAAVAGVGLLFLWGLRTPPVPVDSAEIGKGDLMVSIDEEGVTRIKDVYTVSAPITGKLRRLSLDAGDRVIKDRTIVAIIEPLAPAFQDVRSISIARAGVKSAEAALTLAKAELARSQSDLEFASNEFRRIDRLYKKRIVARKVFDQAQSELRSAEANVAAAQANVEVQRKDLESASAALIQPGSEAEPTMTEDGERECCLTIKAPVSGRVLSMKQKSEHVVTAGTTIMEIGDDKDLEIVVELLSTDAVRIRRDARALVEGWGGEKALSATVRHVEPAGFTKVSALGIEEQRVRVLLDFKGDPDAAAQLGHDFRVFTRIEVWQGEDLTLVPLSALFRKGEDWHVFVKSGSHAELRKVEIDHRNRRFAEVVKGLKTGEKVLLHPSDRVEDGVRIVERANL